MKDGTIEQNYYYAIRIQTMRKNSRKARYPAFLARQNASAPALFWFHEDAVKYLEKIKCESGCDCGKCGEKKSDIVKVFVRWNDNGKTYNTPGDMFRSHEELKRKKSTQDSNLKP